MARQSAQIQPVEKLDPVWSRVREEAIRIHRGLSDAHFVMQVRRGGAASGTDSADEFAPADFLTG